MSKSNNKKRKKKEKKGPHKFYRQSALLNALLFPNKLIMRPTFVFFKFGNCALNRSSLINSWWTRLQILFFITAVLLTAYSIGNSIFVKKLQVPI